MDLDPDKNEINWKSRKISRLLILSDKMGPHHKKMGPHHLFLIIKMGSHRPSYHPNHFMNKKSTSRVCWFCPTTFSSSSMSINLICGSTNDQDDHKMIKMITRLSQDDQDDQDDHKMIKMITRWSQDYNKMITRLWQDDQDDHRMITIWSKDDQYDQYDHLHILCSFARLDSLRLLGLQLPGERIIPKYSPMFTNVYLQNQFSPMFTNVHQCLSSKLIFTNVHQCSPWTSMFTNVHL